LTETSSTLDVLLQFLKRINRSNWQLLFDLLSIDNALKVTVVSCPLFLRWKYGSL